jgi:hypothetical protein
MVSGMAFKNLPTSITIPADTSSGPRIFIGPDIPPDLAAFYLAQHNESILGAMIFYGYDGFDYVYLALAVGNVSQTPNLVIGKSQIAFTTFYEDMRFVTNNGGVPTFLYSTFIQYQNEAGNATPGSWQQFSFANGWANLGAGFVVGQYRLVPSPLRSLQLIGFIKPGTRTVGTIITTLPVGYRPFYSHRPVVDWDVTTAGAETPALSFNPSGQLSLAVAFPAAASFMYLNALIPLDALGI